jgi:hypothetical protein
MTQGNLLTSRSRPDKLDGMLTLKFIAIAIKNRMHAGIGGPMGACARN